MGRPKHVAPARTGTNRREFFQRSGGAAAALASAVALPLLPAPQAPRGPCSSMAWPVATRWPTA